MIYMHIYEYNLCKTWVTVNIYGSSIMGHIVMGLWTASPTSNITFHNSEVKWMEIQILKARAKNL